MRLTVWAIADLVTHTARALINPPSQPGGFFCYAHQPVTFRMGIDAQCVKAASEINENRTVATAARKIQNINLMPGPSGYGVP